LSERKFIPVGIAVMTVSDSRTEETDTSGPYLESAIAETGHRLAGKAIVPDDVERIVAQVREFCSDRAVDVIISTGGTGLTRRDVTPEAVIPMFDKVIEGFSAVWHRVSYDSVGLSTIQSRACAGIIKGRFVFCLPGSNGAVRDGWTKVIAPQLDHRTRPCNLIEIMPRVREMSELTHFDSEGRPKMVDVSGKVESARVAIARGFVSVPDALLAQITGGAIGKGDPVAIAELAGIMAAKRTADLIPLCHPLALDSVGVSIEPEAGGLAVEAEAATNGRTGVEMEAMTAVAVACLTLYDMLKGAAREIRIERIELVEKRGGKSGVWSRG
jgi:molybdenum cofactor biosynthesis protein B